MDDWPDTFFRPLNEPEEREFRQWARDYYRIGEPIPSFWHPTLRDECRQMTEEAASALADGTLAFD